MKAHLPSSHENAVLDLAKARPLLKAQDLEQHKLPTVVLTRLVDAGRLERVSRGIYCLPTQPASEYRSLAEVAFLASYQSSRRGAADKAGCDSTGTYVGACISYKIG
jgi:hypothetical protein